MKEQNYSQCQSCGMPLKMDKNGGGTEKDGTLSKKYCSSCYRNGSFVDQEMTAEKMKEKVDSILKNEMKWWKPLRWLAVRQIPSLERWKNK